MPEIALPTERACALIEAQFPELAPTRVERLGHGMDNNGFRVNEVFVFRFPQRAVAVPLIEREMRLLPCIASALPLPIPVPRYMGTPSEGYPWPFEGHAYLAGTTACSTPLTGDDRFELARSLGTFLRALHAIDPGASLERGLPRDEIGRLDHAKRLPLATERLLKLERLGVVSGANALLETMRAIAPNDGDFQRLVILHGDLYARHLLIDEHRRLSGIIDWGDIHFGHPGVDLAIVFTMLPVTAHAEFFEAYGAVDARTLQLALYRAIYHSALVADFGLEIGDHALAEAGIEGLRFVQRSA